jgi:hypothetical protein
MSEVEDKEYDGVEVVDCQFCGTITDDWDCV